MLNRFIAKRKRERAPLKDSTDIETEKGKAKK